MKNIRCEAALEQELRSRGFQAVAGVDEVGRGALFGPVCAAAVVLEMGAIPNGINDSKKLSPKQRRQLAENIRAEAKDYCIAFVQPSVIDQINILEATREAMRRAVGGLRERPDYLLCDGIVITALDIPQNYIVKGDALSLSIAAASILAKVERDQLITCLDLEYPGYDLKQNKGYGTSNHLAAIKSLGPTPYHRLTFRGVRC